MGSSHLTPLVNYSKSLIDRHSVLNIFFLVHCWVHNNVLRTFWYFIGGEWSSVSYITITLWIYRKRANTNKARLFLLLLNHDFWKSVYCKSLYLWLLKSFVAILWFRKTNQILCSICFCPSCKNVGGRLHSAANCLALRFIE